MAVLWVAQLVRLWLTYAWKSLKILLLKRHKQNQKHGNALFHDSFSIIKKTVITSFLNSLNNIGPNISLTIELELDNKIPFSIRTLITRHMVTTSKLMYLGNLHTQTDILILTHTMTLNTKLAQLELLYTEH